MSHWNCLLGSDAQRNRQAGAAGRPTVPHSGPKRLGASCGCEPAGPRSLCLKIKVALACQIFEVWTNSICIESLNTGSRIRSLQRSLLGFFIHDKLLLV